MIHALVAMAAMLVGGALVRWQLAQVLAAHEALYDAAKRWQRARLGGTSDDVAKAEDWMMAVLSGVEHVAQGRRDGLW